MRLIQHIFAIMHPRAVLSDVEGTRVRTKRRPPQAMIAAISGRMPTMFITRVRL